MSPLREQEQRILIAIAKAAVDAHLAGRALKFEPVHEGSLAERRGVFVSIHETARLRGCVGNVEPDEPLYRATARCAIAAAVADPRFAPLTTGEMSLVSFELSVLSPPEILHDPGEIEVGTHGLIVSKGAARGLLLPQVAASQCWDRYRFLAETCLKAGLRPDAWKQGAQIHQFTAQVFGES